MSMRPVRTALPMLLAATLLPSLARDVPLNAQPPDAEPLARIEQIIVGGRKTDAPTTTDVKVIRGTSLVAAAPSLSLFADDEVITGVNVAMTILVLDVAVEQDNTVHIGPASQFRLRGKRSVFLILGRLLADVRGLFDVVTSRATLGAKSTEFEVRVSESETQLVVLEGLVTVTEESTGRGGQPPPVAVKLTVPFVSRVDRFAPPLRLASLSFPPQAQETPHQRWLVEVDSNAPVRTKQQVTISNRCQKPHLYDVEGPETLPWFNLFIPQRVEVRPGATRSVEVEVQIDPSNVPADTYTGNAAIRCLDCFSEPGCSQSRDVFPVQIKLARSAELTVKSLEEITIGSATVPAAPRKATEERVRTTVNWTNDVIVAGQPSFSARRVIPRFETPEQRGRAFRDARFAAFWRGDAASLERLGEVYTDWGEGAKAVEAFNHGAAIQPERTRTPEFMTRLGEATRLQGRLDEAEQQLRRALEADPRNPIALNSLGNVFVDRADVALEGNDARTGAGWLERARTNYERASELLPAQLRDAQAVAKANTGEVHVQLGQVALREKRFDVARRQYETADGLFKDAHSTSARYAFSRTGWGDAFLGLGLVAAERGDSSAERDALVRADAQYRTGVQSHPDLPQNHVGVGDVLVRQGRTKEALGSYIRATTVKPDDPAAYYRVGALLANDNPVLASRYLSTFLQLQRPPLRAGRTSRNASQLLERVRTGPVVPTKPVEPSPPPKTGSQQVPDVMNLTLADATRAIEAAGFRVGRVEHKNSTRPAGTIIKQDPRAKRTERAGTAIDLEVARREVKTVRVPSIVGDTREHAIDDIREERLQLGTITEQPGCTPGRVLSQEPAKDTRVPEGTVVSFTVAVPGPQGVMVPSVTGIPQGRAEAALGERGLRAGRIRRSETDRMAPGSVLSQDPRPNVALAPGCAVDLEIAIPIPMVTVPNFVGMTEAQVRQRLPRGLAGAFAELRLGDVVYRDYPGDAAYYSRMSRGQPRITEPTVVEQQPAPNTQVRRGNEIALVIVRPPAGDTTPRTTVPRLQGMTVEEARKVLAGAYLTLGDVRYSKPQTTRAPSYRIIAQEPAANLTVTRGTRVTVTIEGYQQIIR